MDTPIFRTYLDAKGMALFLAIGLMVIIFLLGTAALTIINIESKINRNYIQSVQALYDCEAGIAEAMARINDDTLTLDQWEQATDSKLFQYQYKVTYDPNQSLYYQFVSEGKDPTRTANRRILVEINVPFLISDISSPVYCKKAKNKDQSTIINGDSNCPSWADDGDPNNDQSVSCISTLRSYVNDKDPINFKPNQLITSNPYQITYNAREIKVDSLANYYEDLPPDVTEIPEGESVTIGSPNDLKVVYIRGGKHTNLRNITGYGVLMVKRDLHISEKLNWNGIIIVLGKARIKGGGTITGAIITPNDFDTGNNVQIQWCGDVIRKVITETGKPPLHIVSWKEG